MAGGEEKKECTNMACTTALMKKRKIPRITILAGFSHNSYECSIPYNVQLESDVLQAKALQIRPQSQRQPLDPRYVMRMEEM